VAVIVSGCSLFADIGGMVHCIWLFSCDHVVKDGGKEERYSRLLLLTKYVVMEYYH
jgi:hypothetical protein